MTISYEDTEQVAVTSFGDRTDILLPQRVNLLDHEISQSKEEGQDGEEMREIQPSKMKLPELQNRIVPEFLSF